MLFVVHHIFPSPQSHAVSYLAFLEAPSGDMAQTPQSFLLAASKRNT